MAPVVLCCVALGIAFPEVLSHLNGVTVGLFAFMTFANSLGGGFRELTEVVRHPLPVVVIFGLLHVVMPLITLGLGTLCFPDAPLFTIGLVLEYAVPTGVASLMWVGMSRGNTALCLSVVLLDTLLSPVVIPLDHEAAGGLGGGAGHLGHDAGPAADGGASGSGSHGAVPADKGCRGGHAEAEGSPCPPRRPCCSSSRPMPPAARPSSGT